MFMERSGVSFRSAGPCGRCMLPVLAPDPLVAYWVVSMGLAEQQDGVVRIYVGSRTAVGSCAQGRFRSNGPLRKPT